MHRVPIVLRFEATGATKHTSLKEVPPFEQCGSLVLPDLPSESDCERMLLCTIQQPHCIWPSVYTTKRVLSKVLSLLSTNLPF